MKINIFEKGAHATLEDMLLRTLKKIYTGEGLWAEIEQITIDYAPCDENDDSPLITAKIRFGRYVEGGDLNFQDMVEIDDIDEELDISFFTGRFYQYIMTTEPKFTKE